MNGSGIQPVHDLDPIRRCASLRDAVEPLSIVFLMLAQQTGGAVFSVPRFLRL
jgi:hypothetical protein